MNSKNKTVQGFVALCAMALVMGYTTTPTQASTQAEAQARVGCVGAGCRGKNPTAMGCDRDARTLTVAHDAHFKVELRYSKRCNARWARTTYLDFRGDSPYIYAQLGSGEVTRVDALGPVVWSRMWTGRIRACGGAPGGESPFTSPTIVCTVAR